MNTPPLFVRIFFSTLFFFPFISIAQSDQQTIEHLQQQIDELNQQLQQLTVEQPSQDDSNSGLQWGGAMRFQYATGNYNQAKNKRNGDLDFDIFRINVRGNIQDIILDVEWRWFEYMSSVQRAWVGYDIDERQQVQFGLTRLPFGNQGYNSHNYFFSSNYYLGLEDNHKMGGQYIFQGERINIQAALFKNDSIGGGAESYHYHLSGLGQLDADGNIQEDAQLINTAALRVAQTFSPRSDWDIEVGASGVYGQIDNTQGDRYGHYSAMALHSTIDYKRVNIQLQASRYHYNHDQQADEVVVSAYAYHDVIARKAHSYTANIAYHLPVALGPIQGLDFYNDFSLITKKSGGYKDTIMNVTGVGVSAGALYTYFDYVIARNQPFVGSSMVSNTGTQHRFNVNVGFYF